MDDDHICASSPNWNHEPDWNSVHISHDGGGVYIDVNCKHCGLSGCIGTEKTLTEGISWDDS